MQHHYVCWSGACLVIVWSLCEQCMRPGGYPRWSSAFTTHGTNVLLNVLPSQLYDADMIVYDMLNPFSMFQLLTDHLSPPYVQSKRKDHGNGSRHEVC